jgi:ribonuclease E
MASKMLIDASHPEETRVVVMRGNRVEEFDFESANRKQLRGNIYLAKVTRVEPSLQAAFVDYGGNRHGFLAFSEIHPDYYQIPVADRQALIAAQERAERDADAEADNRAGRRNSRHRSRTFSRPQEAVRSESLDSSAGGSEVTDAQPGPQEFSHDSAQTAAEQATPQSAPEPTSEQAAAPAVIEPTSPDEQQHFAPEASESPSGEMESAPSADTNEVFEQQDAEPGQNGQAASENSNGNLSQPGSHAEGQSNGHGDEQPDEEAVESVGGADALEEVQERMPRVRARQYKIQEVIKRRQVMLVQVVKEERGTKGAALTTYLSLAGRYCVLMPNTSRGGGISRKITSAEDRSRLKEIAQDLEVPEGMGVILRTAGASRTKTEVKRDFEYLLRIWETVRDLTLKSTAPKLVYEEGSLVKRSIRDLYSKDIDEIIVAGDEGYKDAKEFMRMLMPSHAKNVKLYRDSQPVFTRFGIESQLDAMFSPTVQLKSGGYIVINQAEALVAIDVNSGRATREHSIEDTAVKTNSEAAEEVARQLRLRDLAGLIVIDFIDMDERRNNHTVERRMKDALKHDRARIQVGRISHFGLLEMSRQRIRTSVLESSTEKCPICGGSGHVRSVSSVTLALLRAIEEMLIKGATHNLIVRTRPEVALYVLNQKRGHLRALEERFRVTITVSADASVVGANAFVVDRGEQVHTAEAARELAASQPTTFAPSEDEPPEELSEELPEESSEESSEYPAETEALSEAAPVAASDTERQSSHSRRRRRGGRGRSGESHGTREPSPPTKAFGSEQADPQQESSSGPASVENLSEPQGGVTGQSESHGENHDGSKRRRRRGRRGGRRHRRNGDNGGYQGQRDQNGAQASNGGESASTAAEGGGMPTESAQYEHGSPVPAAAPPEMPREHAPEPSTPDVAQAADSPRRGSTVREPVSFTRQAQAEPQKPSPASQPRAASSSVLSSPASEEQAPPKRGWWGRRIMGDKT